MNRLALTLLNLIMRKSLVAGVLLVGALTWMAGCAPTRPAPAGLDLQAQAAAQATLIIQQARATALIQNARATANALLTPAGAPPGALAATATLIPAATTTKVGEQTVLSPEASPTLLVDATPAATTQPVRLLSLSFGANQNLLHVQFIAPLKVIQRWQQGNMYILDEATGNKYEEIPIMPVVGALFGKPNQDEQPGYVMFTNLPVPLQPGAVVTIVLGEYRWEHLNFPSQTIP